MVIGASTNPDKYGNKAVRAYLRQGHDPVPINPSADTVEGIPAFPDVTVPAGPFDRATVYLPPDKVLDVLPALAARGDVKELWLNPGSESEQVVTKARELGFDPIQACSIVDIGERP